MYLSVILTKSLTTHLGMMYKYKGCHCLEALVHSPTLIKYTKDVFVCHFTKSVTTHWGRVYTYKGRPTLQVRITHVLVRCSLYYEKCNYTLGKGVCA